MGVYFVGVCYAAMEFTRVTPHFETHHLVRTETLAESWASPAPNDVFDVNSTLTPSSSRLDLCSWASSSVGERSTNLDEEKDKNDERDARLVVRVRNTFLDFHVQASAGRRARSEPVLRIGSESVRPTLTFARPLGRDARREMACGLYKGGHESADDVSQKMGELRLDDPSCSNSGVQRAEGALKVGNCVHLSVALTTGHQGAHNNGGSTSKDGQRKDTRKSRDLVAEAKKNPGSVWSLACGGTTSSMAVQLKLKAVAQSVIEAESTGARSRALADLRVLVGELEGHEIEAASHPSANYFANLVLEIAPPSMTAFIAAALLGRSVQLSRSRIGCRIIIRVLRHHLPEGFTAAVCLGDELLSEASCLLRNEFANFVMQELFLRGSASQRQTIVKALGGCTDEQEHESEWLRNELLRNATRLHASRVLQTVLCNCSEEVFDVLSTRLISSRANLRTLVKSPCGRHVAFTLSSLLQSSDCKKSTLDAILATTTALG